MKIIVAFSAIGVFVGFFGTFIAMLVGVVIEGGTIWDDALLLPLFWKATPIFAVIFGIAGAVIGAIIGAFVAFINTMVVWAWS